MPRRQRRLGYAIAAAAFLVIGVLTLLPASGEVARAARTPVWCILCGDLGTVDFLLNILLFVPLGIGLRLAGFSWRRAIVLAALLSCGVELLQMKVITGRDASLGDLIANTLGGALGAVAGTHWQLLIRPKAPQAQRMALTLAITLLAIWVGTAWALGPAFPRGARWYGAWAPELDNLETFPGRPLMVIAGGEPLLPGGPALDQQRLEDAVTARPSIAFRAILAEQPTGMAPIGLIVDGWHRDVILIGQDRQDLAFQISMRASIVKLRTPTVNLRNGMAGQPGDTAEAEGALRDGVFELRSQLHGRELTRRLPLSASWGWSLVTPWNSVLGEEVRSLTAFWIVGLVALLVYWSVLAGGASLVTIPVTLLLMLAAIPAAASFPPVHWSEWAAAAVGVLIGSFAAWRARRKRGGSETDPEDEEAPSMEAAG